MKVMAFNGSPRKKKWNTVTLLKSALEGAASVGAETELVQLYDLDFSGCMSCFSCSSLFTRSIFVDNQKSFRPQSSFFRSDYHRTSASLSNRCGTG